jgi:tRNA-dihydrouridine synthase B
MDHEGEPEPRVVQLAGADPEALADAARRNIDLGAQIIDINMG